MILDYLLIDGLDISKPINGPEEYEVEFETLEDVPKESEERYIFISEVDTLKKPAEDITATHVVGRNGDVILNRAKRSFQNVEISYLVTCMKNFQETYDKIVRYLYKLDGYVEIESDNTHYRLGYFVTETQPNSQVRDAGNFTITFSCKPQRFLREGKSPLVYTFKNKLFVSDDVTVTNMTYTEADSKKASDPVAKAIVEGFPNQSTNYTAITYRVTNNKSTMYKFRSASGSYTTIQTSYFVGEPAISTYRGTVEGKNSRTQLTFRDGVYCIFVCPSNMAMSFFIDNVLKYSTAEQGTIEVYNLYSQTAKPLICFRKSNDYPLSVFNCTWNGQTFTYAGGGNNQKRDETFYIDGETMEMYAINAGEKINRSTSVGFIDNIDLKSGINYISAADGLEIEIIPRWWQI